MRRACRVVRIGRSTYYYRTVRDDRALRQRILEIAETRVRYGDKRIHVLLRRADIHGLRFHDLRHTAGTRMQESGVGIVEITKILGNSSIEMTMKRYVHPEESLRSAVDKLANFGKDCSKNCSNEKDGTS